MQTMSVEYILLNAKPQDITMLNRRINLIVKLRTGLLHSKSLLVVLLIAGIGAGNAVTAELGL